MTFVEAARYRRSGHVVAAGGFRPLLTPLSNGYIACKKSTFGPLHLSLFLSLYAWLLSCLTWPPLWQQQQQQLAAHGKESEKCFFCGSSSLRQSNPPRLPPILSSHINPAIHYSIKRTPYTTAAADAATTAIVSPFYNNPML